MKNPTLRRIAFSVLLLSLGQAASAGLPSEPRGAFADEPAPAQMEVAPAEQIELAIWPFCGKKCKWRKAEKPSGCGAKLSAQGNGPKSCTVAPAGRG